MSLTNISFTLAVQWTENWLAVPFQLYEANAGRISETPGVSMVHKLKYKHLHLTNFSKMRVDLDVQLIVILVNTHDVLFFCLRLCRSQWQLPLSWNLETLLVKLSNLSETWITFDCFNVSSFTKGKLKQNWLLSPYHKDNDFRMEVCVLVVT